MNQKRFEELKEAPIMTKKPEPIDFDIPGRMVGPSKRGYIAAHPDNAVFFNANLCTKSKGKIWYGDLDLTLDKYEVRRLAVELDEEVYVLQEMDARFNNETEPNFESAVAVFSPDGDMDIRSAL